MMRPTALFLPALMMVLAVASAAGADASFELYATGFESPTFAAGALGGQDGWTARTSTVVTATQAAAGSQSVRVVASGAYDGLLHSAAFHDMMLPLVTTGVTLSQDVLISSADEADFAVAALNGASVISLVRFSYEGDILVNGLDTGHNWTAGVWRSLVLSFDMQAFLLDVTYGGTLVAENAQGGWFDGLALASDDFVFDGSSMYVDNLNVTVVPAPAALGLVAAGLAGLLRRKCQR